MFPTTSLVLDFSNGDRKEFYPALLRERCGEMQASTKQRLFEISDVLDKANIVDAKVLQGGKQLQVKFDDNVVGEFLVEELLEENTERIYELPGRVPWSGQELDIDNIRFPFTGRDYLNIEKPFLAKVAETILGYGACIIRNLPAEEGVVLRVAGQMGTVRRTEWGEHFEVITKESDGTTVTEDLAYTNHAIDLHVDNPYRRPIPGVWMLHCIQDVPTTPEFPTNGSSTISDGIGAAMALRKEDPESFRMLSTTKVMYTYALKTDIDLSFPQETIQVNKETGEIEKVIFSGRLDSVPLSLNWKQARDYYLARKKFLDLARSRALHFRLEPGDMVLLDNNRVMHGRSEIHSSDGIKPRYLQGAYMDMDGITSTLFTGRKVQQKQTCDDKHVTISDAHIHQRPMEENAKPSRAQWRSLNGISGVETVSMTEAYNEECSPAQLTKQALAMVKALDNDKLYGQPVTLYEHSLQTATRAAQAGEDAEIIVAALLHDVGEVISPSAHGDVAAAILKPYVSPKTHWILANHEVFQAKYYIHHLGGNPDGAEKLYKEHEYYEDCVRFCRDYDAPSFDASFTSFPLEYFTPYLEQIFSRAPYWYDETHPKRSVVLG